MKIDRKMTLAEAFRIRNLLKQKLCKLNALYARAEKIWRVDFGRRDEQSLGRSATNLIDASMRVMNILGRFNVEINKANFTSGAQEVNLALNTIGDQINFLDNVLDDANRFKSVGFEVNHATGENTRVEYATDLNASALAEHLQQLKNTKFSLETKLSEKNAALKFELHESLAEEIEAALDELTG